MHSGRFYLAPEVHSLNLAIGHFSKRNKIQFKRKMVANLKLSVFVNFISSRYNDWKLEYGGGVKGSEDHLSNEWKVLNCIINWDLGKEFWSFRCRSSSTNLPMCQVQIMAAIFLLIVAECTQSCSLVMQCDQIHHHLSHFYKTVATI